MIFLVVGGLEVLEKFEIDEKVVVIYLNSVKELIVVKDFEFVVLFYFRKYVCWILDYIYFDVCYGLVGFVDEIEQKVIFDKLVSLGIEGEGLVCIGCNFEVILKNEMNFFEFLVVDNILERIYVDGFVKFFFNQMVEYIGFLVNKDFQMDIFEVGVGIGSVMMFFFVLFGDDVFDKIYKYYYIDILIFFFDIVKECLEKWLSFFEYKILDILKDFVD